VDIINEMIAGISWELVIKTCLRLTLIMIFAWAAIKLLKKFLGRLEDRLFEKSRDAGEPLSESEKRIETIVRLVRQGALIGIWVTIVLIVLREFGVDIAPIIASAGILGLAIGFGAQNLVRDIISGFFIILENQIRIGDVAIVNGTGGLVERINFRTTVLRDLGGIVHVFPNGQITTLSNMTKEWSAYVFEIGVAYKENTDRVIEVMREIGESMLADEHFGELMLQAPEIFGVDKFGDSAVVIKGRIRTLPIRQWDVGREFLRRTKLAFDEKGIEIPFPHRTLYMGDASRPFDLSFVEKLSNSQATAGKDAS